MEGHAHCFRGRSHHAESCSPYFSVFEVCDLPRGLDSGGVVYLAIAVLGEPQLAVSYGAGTLRNIAARKDGAVLFHMIAALIEPRMAKKLNL